MESRWEFEGERVIVRGREWLLTWCSDRGHRMSLAVSKDGREALRAAGLLKPGVPVTSMEITEVLGS
jgi:hypothetical protein